jgi:putative acetyltransferase
MTAEKSGEVAYEIRTVTPQDDPAIAAIIRNTLMEFHIHGPGTVYADAGIDHVSSLFAGDRNRYFVACRGQEIFGGAGIHSLDGATDDICELQKMYLIGAVRGKGIGRNLIQKCLAFARASQYATCYLETMPQLTSALKLYEAFGFKYLKAPLGQTGHFACGIWMSVSL